MAHAGAYLVQELCQQEILMLYALKFGHRYLEPLDNQEFPISKDKYFLVCLERTNDNQCPSKSVFSDGVGSSFIENFVRNLSKVFPESFSI